MQVYGIKPPDEFLGLVKKEKQGKIIDKDIRKVLDQKYRVKERSVSYGTGSKC